MSASKRSIDPASEDEAPDLSSPEWRAKFEAVPVKRGRPPSERPKVSTTIRLDPDVLDAFKGTGPGWQSRINETLRRAATRLKAR